MYNKISEKIKGLAKAVFIIDAFAAVVVAIALLGSGDDDYLIIGVLILLIGPIIAWASSWLLYGFGELIEKIYEIEFNTRGESLASKNQKTAKANDQDNIISNNENFLEKINIENSLKMLEDARSCGVITEAEYQEQKTHLSNQLQLLK